MDKNRKEISDTEDYLPFFLGSSTEEAEATYARFTPFLKKISYNYSNVSGLDEGDMFGESLNGLAKALRDYDPERSDQFFSYCCFRVRNELNRYCKKNNSILNVPIYIKDTNIHIEKIKNILLKFNVSDEDVEKIISSGKLTIELPALVSKVIKEHIKKIKTIAKNSGVKYKNLVSRAEFIPSNVLYNEGLNQDDIYKREMQVLDAKLAVVSLRAYMDEDDLIISEGIMKGKTYEEIGKEFDKTSAWVKTRLNKIKNRFLEEQESED